MVTFNFKTHHLTLNLKKTKNIQLFHEALRTIKFKIKFTFVKFESCLILS